MREWVESGSSFGKSISLLNVRELHNKDKVINMSEA